MKTLNILLNNSQYIPVRAEIRQIFKSIIISDSRESPTNLLLMYIITSATETYG